jgi:hypothetical protein
MPNYFCTFCPAKIQYEATKPTKCPKCGKSFASAFKVAAPVTPAVAVAQVAPEEDDDVPISPRSRKSHSTTQAKPRYRGGEYLPPIMGVASSSPSSGPGDEGEDDDEEDVDPRMRRRLARELAASINPEDIHVSDDDEKPLRFEDMYNAPDARQRRGN